MIIIAFDYIATLLVTRCVIKIITFIINFYQRYLSFDRGLLAFFTPGGACRYQITCSEYTKQKIREFGVFRGIGAGLRRIWRCR